MFIKNFFGRQIIGTDIFERADIFCTTAGETETVSEESPVSAMLIDIVFSETHRLPGIFIKEPDERITADIG